MKMKMFPMFLVAVSVVFSLTSYGVGGKRPPRLLSDAPTITDISQAVPIDEFDATQIEPMIFQRQ